MVYENKWPLNIWRK